ncbi:GNAT family N-acetyltransferase [Pelagibacterium xiamenense]|uniref:GNAT family N-acetyltransferase n=1 Tax=Pelagibacterium xiamenense TaxID=2901140 RepID=UPI001E433073|nr:GNAT family N-acetyltransferase [Pelagibacterium xiamenense]MCD7059038.1 GNAT family N-acetyltransferase [Pelagibacterium xiamenense]
MAMQAAYEQTAAAGFTIDAVEGLDVAVFDTLEAVEPIWRELETRAVLTPYQTFDWINAYQATGFSPEARIRVIVWTDNGRPVALLPLAIGSRFGVRVGQVIGMEISNGDSLVFDPAYAEKMTPRAIRAALKVLGKTGAGVDIVNFHCLFAHEPDQPNPLLAFPHAPAPDHFYWCAFEEAEGSYIDKVLPHKRRTNIRRSMRRLQEGFGELQLRHATSEEEIAALHDVFVAQRGKRFKQMGVENIFARPQFATLFKTAARTGIERGTPVLRYHALYAGETVVATSIGVYSGKHYSQYINSTTDGQAAKYTLMGVTLSLLVDELRAEGITTFDMGLGDFEYKTEWTSRYTVYDSVVPVSLCGQMAAPMLRAARQAKRTIKQTPALWNLARKVLALKARRVDG